MGATHRMGPATVLVTLCRRSFAYVLLLVVPPPPPPSLQKLKQGERGSVGSRSRSRSHSRRDSTSGSRSQSRSGSRSRSRPSSRLSGSFATAPILLPTATLHELAFASCVVPSSSVHTLDSVSNGAVGTGGLAAWSSPATAPYPASASDDPLRDSSQLDLAAAVEAEITLDELQVMSCL